MPTPSFAGAGSGAGAGAGAGPSSSVFGVGAGAGASSSGRLPIATGSVGVKRSVSGEEVAGVEYLEFQPLGAGCEVGRSCHILRYKGKTIMLDCGILPSFQGIEALPLVQEINPADIDIIFIT
jgi:hypothetical protein